jgi:hypothetical protein
LNKIERSKRVSIDEILSTEIALKEEDIDELRLRCSIFNVGLIGIDKFECTILADRYNVDFSAAVISGEDDYNRILTIYGLNALLEI